MSAIEPRTVTGWARFLGVTLRPWAGRAPLELILRGVIQSAVAGVLIYAWVTMGGERESLDPALGAIILPVLVIAVITVGYLLISGLGTLVIGILDFGPRQTFSGYVDSQRERKLGDFLPVFVQRQIWARRNVHGIDKRKTRWEVVIATETGDKAFTVRKFKTRNLLTVGSQVTIKVTPIANYIDRVENR